MGYIQEARENHVKKKVEEGIYVFKAQTLGLKNYYFSFLFFILCYKSCVIWFVN